MASSSYSSSSCANSQLCLNPSEEMAAREGKEEEEEAGAPMILLWSHPRSVSTAVERAFMQRDADFQCVHEPFWEPFFWGPERSAVHRHPRPGFFLRNTTFHEVTQKLQTMGAAASPRRLFVKDMAYFVVLSEAERELSPTPTPGPKLLIPTPTLGSKLLNPTILPEQVLRTVTHTFLIRTPAQAVPSLYRRMMGFSRAAVQVGGPQLPLLRGLVGIAEQRALFDYVAELGGGLVPLVMDAEDVVRDPEGMMRAYCAAVGVDFRMHMLEWEVAKGESKFMHCRGLRARLLHHFVIKDFYRDVENSTGFGQIQPRCRQQQAQEQAALAANLPKEVEDVIQENMPHYHHLRQFRIKPVARMQPSAGEV